MPKSTRSGWSWRFAAGLVAIAALAQACGGSSQNSGPSGGRLELRFKGVKGARLGLLPQGCQSVDITIQPDGKTVTASDTTVSLLLPAGQHSASGVLHCSGQDFPSDTPDPVFTVPPSLGSVEVALVFGGVNVDLTVQVSGGIQVTGTGINCPADCTESYFSGTSVKLTANQPNAVFSGGCSGTGSCTVLMNASKTVFVSLPASGGDLQVTNTAGGPCCDTGSITFSGPGSIPSISDLSPGQSATRSNLTPGNYVANWCSGPSPFSIQAGQTTTLNLNGADCG